jgi:predicted esterase
MSRTPILKLAALGVLVAASLVGHEGSAQAEKFTLATLSYQPEWCAAEFEPLGDDVCHVTGTPAADGKRTLVIFLHGVIAKNTMWQWLQERGMARIAKELHFDAIVPQAPKVGVNGSGGFAWPGLGPSKNVDEQALIDGWLAARRKLEEKNGRKFDETYVVGFSSGAYFATGLALKAKMDIDGYVVLAGGSPGQPSPEATGARRVPVYVGVCSEDKASAPSARNLGHLLAANGWPVRTEEQPVGHGVSDIHVARALAFFRSHHDRRLALNDATGSR